ncbi:MAG: AAA family ATPase, partial [Planctomycetaceae bacterium]|nr:AAA family ATPase [Planctomycetaceae bacterium]
MLSDRKLPVGVQDFEKLRLGQNVYVDKTRYLYNLIKLPISYFLNRPRRFGKSLFLSTIMAYFRGQKELFDGLEIAKLEKEWLQYPVFHIDMNVESYVNIDSIYKALDTNLNKLEEQWGKNEIETTPSSRLLGLISRAWEKSGRRVVVLIDEYDKPLINSLHKSEINDSIREILKGFYGVLKSADAHLHFVFITGVTKFSHVSVFSDL